MDTSKEVHTLTGAYVLDALSDAERRAFEHHMTACRTCWQEVLELRETAARLGNATTRTPPRVMWDKVRKVTATTRQLSSKMVRRRRSS